MQIDIDGRRIGRRYPIEVGLVGDAGETLSALLPLLGPRDGREWRREVEQSVARWHRIAGERAGLAIMRLNPERVIRALSHHLPADAQVSLDVGSVVYWYARHLRLPRGVPAHLSSTLASMGSAIPYGIAAKLAHPGRPLVALAGDGAMQMSGLAELITVAHRWRDWSDPRFVVCVLDNGDLAEVTWEQRETEGEPRYDESQALPAFPYAGYAELLGLASLRVEDPADIDDAWREALACDRPFLLHAVVDADAPLLPPFPAGAEKLESMRAGLEQEGESGRQARKLLEAHAAQESDRA